MANLLRKLLSRCAQGKDDSLPPVPPPQVMPDPTNPLTIQAILREYDVQTRDRRLYAQSMFGTIGFVVAGGIALLAAADQAKQPLTLLLIPPLCLAGGLLVVVLRIHLLRVSVFLTVVEDDLRQRLGEAAFPIVWETSMTGRTGVVTSLSAPARSSAGLSLTIMLLMGSALSLLLLWPATLLYWQAARVTSVDLVGSVSQLLSAPPILVEWAYPALNLSLVAYIAWSWARLPRALESSRIHFRRTRNRISDGSDEVHLTSVSCDEHDGAIGECWAARWEGRRDGGLIVIERVDKIAGRRQALRWGRQRATRIYSRTDDGGESLERMTGRRLRRVAGLLRRSRSRS